MMRAEYRDGRTVGTPLFVRTSVTGDQSAAPTVDGCRPRIGMEPCHQRPRTTESHPLRSGFLKIIPAASYSPGQFPTKYHRR